MKDVMIYNLRNYQNLNSIYLHDYELKDIIIDYNNKELTIHLINSDNKKRTFKITFYSFFIECFEPWGQGIYIDSFTVLLHRLEFGMECIKIEFLLNSGDKLKIMAKEILLTSTSEEIEK